MHTILGAGGPVSTALAGILAEKNEPVRLVSRRPIAAKGNTTWAGADLKNYDEVMRAAKGATTLYLTAGLKYDRAVWAAEWPVIMSNVVRATKETGARLIFFDNVYMYGPVMGAMTEATPYHPASVKGTTRARIAAQLMDEAAAGHISATIARAPDFYGTGGLNSFFDLMILKRFSEGKAAQWMGDARSKHSFIYIPDAAKALVLLAERPESENQIWHLPTAPALAGTEFIGLAAAAYGVAPKSSKINRKMLRAIGLFNKLIGETAELYYQCRDDYIFDSTKFEQAFSFSPTPYKDGIAAAAKHFPGK